MSEQKQTDHDFASVLVANALLREALRVALLDIDTLARAQVTDEGEWLRVMRRIESAMDSTPAPLAVVKLEASSHSSSEPKQQICWIDGDAIPQGEYTAIIVAKEE